MIGYQVTLSKLVFKKVLVCLSGIEWPDEKKEKQKNTDEDTILSIHGNTTSFHFVLNEVGRETRELLLKMAIVVLFE